MGQNRCFICCQQCIPKINIENPSNTETSDGSSVDNQLQVIFLLRKLLEISEDTCCKLLKHFGNPNTWIECCDSCSVLVERCQSILQQIASLEEHYNELRMSIKNTILKSQKHLDYEYQCEAILKSQIIFKDVDYFIKTTAPESEKFAFVNCEDIQDVSYGSVTNNESFPRIEDQHFVEVDVLPFRYESEQVISVIPDEGLNAIDYNVASGNFDEREELQNDEEFINSERHYVQREIIQSEIDIKPKDLLVEESSIAKELYKPEGKNSGTHSNRKMKNNANKPKFKCPICGNCYVTPTFLQLHMGVHSKVRRYHCEQCDQSFNNNISLQRHMSHAHGHKEFECEMCGQTFKAKDNLNFHEKIHKYDRQYPFTCIMCGESFSELQSLKEHYRKHTEGKNKHFKCLICGNTSGALNDLKAHSVLHWEENLDNDSSTR